MGNTTRKTFVPDFEAITRLRRLLKEDTLRGVARTLDVNPGSISQVLNKDIGHSPKVRRALGLWTLPAWRHEPNAVPLTHISGGALRQCPDCVEEWQRGERTEAETWHWFNTARRKRCVAHARLRCNARRRQAEQGQLKEAV